MDKKKLIITGAVVLGAFILYKMFMSKGGQGSGNPLSTNLGSNLNSTLPVLTGSSVDTGMSYYGGPINVSITSVLPQPKHPHKVSNAKLHVAPPVKMPHSPVHTDIIRARLLPSTLNKSPYSMSMAVKRKPVTKSKPALKKKAA